MKDGHIVVLKRGNARGARVPARIGISSNDMVRQGVLRKAPIELQDLRRRIYVKAKAEPTWRFWGLYVHVCKLETLHTAYRLAKRNNGAPGIDGVTFTQIESAGVFAFLRQLRDELVSGTYRPLRARRKGIPKGDGRTRILSIPAIRDRVVQGALKLILTASGKKGVPQGGVISPLLSNIYRTRWMLCLSGRRRSLATGIPMWSMPGMRTIW